MTKITKSIAQKLNCDTSKGFFYYGRMNEVDVYRVVRVHGGKQGNPKFFFIDDQENVEWIKGLELISEIRRANAEPELVSPDLLY